MRTIAVTGASGYLGRKVVERLGSDDDVARVIGIDVVEPEFSTRNLEFYRLDVRSPELGDVLAACDGLIHLAAVNTKDPAETHDVNVSGTRAVVDAAGRVGVGSFVLTSSHAVYGYHADNDYPLTEDSPVRPAPTSAYAMSKVEAEQVVAYFADRYPDIAVATLRLAWIGGPSLPANPVIESPIRLVVRGYEPGSQAVHEDDAANAVVFALRNGLRGIYNVCADDVVRRQDEIYGQRRVALDLDRARRIFDRTAKLGLSAPAAEMAMMLYPQVLSNERLTGAGFAFERSSEEAMRDAAAARSEWLTVGPVRFRPRRMALIAGTFGAVLIGSRARSARGRRRAKPDSA